MEFRLTYAGELLAHRDDKRLADRSLKVHRIRKAFHRQLKELRRHHPALLGVDDIASAHPDYMMRQVFRHDGFNWLPIVTTGNDLLCRLDILMLRSGPPGRTLSDIDNRLKTIFDALRKAKGPQELGSGTTGGQQVPDVDEDPFFVLLEDDSLITHVAVTSDTLLEPVPGVPYDQAARLVIDVTIQPYRVHTDNLVFN